MMAPQITGTPFENGAPRPARDQPLIRPLRLFVYACFAFGLTPPGVAAGGPLVLFPVGMTALTYLLLRDRSATGRSYLWWTLLLIGPVLLAQGSGILQSSNGDEVPFALATYSVTVPVYVLGMGAWLYLARLPRKELIGGYTLLALFPLAAPLAWMLASLVPWIHGRSDLQIPLAIVSLMTVPTLPLTIGVAVLARWLEGRLKRRAPTRDPDARSTVRPSQAGLG